MGMVARSRAERHEREWISVAAHLERAPVRFTLTFAFGDMPEGWNESRRGASTWAGIVGVVLLTPFITLLAAGLLKSVGIGQPYEWLATSPAAIIAATISLFIGIPVAIVMNLWRDARGGVRREAGALDRLPALAIATPHPFPFPSRPSHPPAL